MNSGNVVFAGAERIANIRSLKTKELDAAQQ